MPRKIKNGEFRVKTDDSDEDLYDENGSIRLRAEKFCPLCERSGKDLRLEEHHLVTRRTDRQNTQDICRECHKQIHAFFTNRDLRNPKLELDTVEGLLKNDRFAKALTFIKKLPPGAFMSTDQANSRKKRR